MTGRSQVGEEPHRISSPTAWIPSGSQSAIGRKLVRSSSVRSGSLKSVASQASKTSVRTAATKLTVIESHLKQGHVVVNVGALAREDILVFVEKLLKRAPHIKILNLKCMPRGIGWSQYDYDCGAVQDSRARHRFIFHTDWHKDGVDLASANAQHKSVRFKLYSALLEILLHSKIEELEIGMRLSPNGYKVLSSGLARSTTIKRLSFAGSHMGDKALMILQDGLEKNSSLEELDLTACKITNMGAACMAEIVKSHANRRVNVAFLRHLREYPDSSRDRVFAQFLYQKTLRAAAMEVDTQCGGLMHIELAENQVTDVGAREMCAALNLDRRLLMLSLRANAISPSAESEFVELMRDHRALMRVDLRQNLDPQMGILKLRKPSQMPAFTPGLGFTRQFQQIPSSPARTEASKALWELMDSTSLMGYSVAGDSMDLLSPLPGSSRDSPFFRTPNASEDGKLPRPPRVDKSNLSTVSWGDMQLLTADAHEQRHQRLSTSINERNQPNLPDIEALMKNQSSFTSYRSILKDPVQRSRSMPGSSVQDLHQEDSFQPLKCASVASMSKGESISDRAFKPQEFSRKDTKDDERPFDERPFDDYVLHQVPQETQKLQSILGSLESTSQGSMIFDELNGPSSSLPTRKQRKEKNGKTKKAVKKIAPKESVSPHDSQKVEAVDKLATIFRELEIAVSSIELLQELRRDEPSPEKQIPLHGHRQVGSRMGSRSETTKMHSFRQTGKPDFSADPLNVDPIISQAGKSENQNLHPSSMPSSVTAVVQQLQRWCDLCDTALLV